MERLVYEAPKDSFSPLYPPCMFQYVGGFTRAEEKYSIILNRVQVPKLCSKDFCISHCSWDDKTLQNFSTSWEINQKVIRVNNNSESDKAIIKDNKTICLCPDKRKINCLVGELPAVYPGQTLSVSLALNFSAQQSAIASVELQHHNLPSTACGVAGGAEIQQTIYSTCAAVNYTLLNVQQHGNWCELFLSHIQPRLATDLFPTYLYQKLYNAFYVKFLPCPLGFTLGITGACICDPLLELVFPSRQVLCNINDQTVLRPASIWIAVIANGCYAFSYCHINYCLSYPFYMNMSNPDSQCQFKRTGLLCGHCQFGFSVVFGSPRCRHCSNVYLLITIPIAITGIALVVLLFMLNLTVTNSAVNSLLFFVNIISINISIFFPDNHSSLLTFLSLLNLDLGFETCFYNGMTDYAKTWLQLAFPIYLFVIAVFIIVISRHSIKVQRLTAAKVLPVLATLFLLSYTKILLTVSSILRFYSKVTSVPSMISTFVWPVDTSVAPFGVKYSLMFVTFLLLFLTLLPANIVILFSRRLSHFQVVNRFKPLLDVYYAPYNDRFYYWTGLQLVIRKIVLFLTLFKEDVNILSVIVLFGVLFCLQGVINPYINKYHNIQEALTILVLLAAHITVFYSKGRTSVTIIQFLILTTMTYLLLSASVECFMKSRFGKKARICWFIFFGNFMHFKSAIDSVNEMYTVPNVRTTVVDTDNDYENFQESLLAIHQ